MNLNCQIAELKGWRVERLGLSAWRLYNPDGDLSMATIDCETEEEAWEYFEEYHWNWTRYTDVALTLLKELNLLIKEAYVEFMLTYNPHYDAWWIMRRREHGYYGLVYSADSPTVAICQAYIIARKEMGL